MLLLKSYFKLYGKLVLWGMFFLISHKPKFKMFSSLYLWGRGRYINVPMFVLFCVSLIDCFAKEEKCCG